MTSFLSLLVSREANKIFCLLLLFSVTFIEVRSQTTFISTQSGNWDEESKWGNANNPLPIELTRLNARVENNVVRLEWETASETNNDFFTVEKSSDAINFEKLTIVQGAGNSTKQIRYSIIDDSPINGISYYRLKQTDFDGLLEFSGVISVQL